MRRNFNIMKVKCMTLVVTLGLSQLNFLEAKHYNQPYGDIMQEENDNSVDVGNGANRFNSRNGQRFGNNYQQPAQDRGRYHDDFATPALSRRKGERDNIQYKNFDGNYNNRKNGYSTRYNLNGWTMSSSVAEDDNITNSEVRENARDNKCNIWVPMDALDKYPDAERKQTNKVAGSVYIEICCKGFAPMRWRGKTLCRPVCDNCQNGRCIAPGVCECYDEYVANDNGDCVFACPLGCLNGRCYLDGSCECDSGYKLDASRKYCKPICSKGCGTNRLHNCTEPEVCGCIKGYILTDNDCQPVCQHDCGTGGICRQPDNCECNRGFELKDEVCQADCYQKCDNGICFSPNRCICNPGFTYHERSTQCIPI